MTVKVWNYLTGDLLAELFGGVGWPLGPQLVTELVATPVLHSVHIVVWPSTDALPSVDGDAVPACTATACTVPAAHSAAVDLDDATAPVAPTAPPPSVFVMTCASHHTAVNPHQHTPRGRVDLWDARCAFFDRNLH
jgi:hypothetical protein